MRQFEGILRRAEKKTQQTYGPMGEVGLAVIQAAVNCHDVTKQWISADTEVKQLVREAYVYFEYIFLYMHLAKRQAFADLSEAKA
ncbi:MAG TPA: hypothetical protein VFN62_12115, partial [Acidobacteriaceae bacterium]|nr:hypothetical protein [Acidobacteriaceae bacterium]